MQLFAKKPTAKEAALAAKRETRREVRSSQRDMDRELRELARQEQQVVLELKQRAKVSNGSHKDPALIALAKQLVQVREQKNKLVQAKAQIGAVGMQATSMASQVRAASAMGSVTSAMSKANQMMNVQETTKIMAEFSRQTQTMQIKEEMMNDALMDAFDQDDIDEQAEEVTQQVLAELGVEMDSKMVGLNVPLAKPKAGEEAMTQEELDALDSVLPDLKARLNAL